jgi:hypothetical protein
VLAMQTAPIRRFAHRARVCFRRKRVPACWAKSAYPVTAPTKHVSRSTWDGTVRLMMTVGHCGVNGVIRAAPVSEHLQVALFEPFWPLEYLARTISSNDSRVTHL